MELEYKRGMSLTTAKTLDKQMRRIGVLDGELRELNLKKKPEIQFKSNVT